MPDLPRSDSPAVPSTITETNLKEVLERPGIVFLDWWAGWCRPCMAFAPIFAAAAARHPDVSWGKVDTEAERGLAQAFGIRSIPTLMIFRDGVLIFAQPGMVPAEGLDQLVAAAKEVDMDEVRRKVAARAAEDAAAAGDGGLPERAARA
jgi:thioredoxin 1